PRHGPCREVDPRQTARRGADLGRRPPPGDVHRHRRRRGGGPGGLVAPPRPGDRRDPRPFPRGVDEPDLGEHRAGPGGGHRQDHDERGDPQGRLHRHRALVPRRGGRLPGPPRHHHTEVLRACSMIPPSASGIESPLTTVYRTARNAAAAMVPTAYSTVDIPASVAAIAWNLRSSAVWRRRAGRVILVFIVHSPSW